jgi:hypothetical protein
MAKKMSRPIRRSVAAWFKEIMLPIVEAREAEPFGRLVGQPITILSRAERTYE